MLRIESPPRSKKLSSTPTRSTPSTSAQIPARAASAAARGATWPVRRRRPVGGRGQGAPVHLAVGGQRQRVQRHERRRAPCSPGSRARSEGAQRGGGRTASPRRPARRRRPAACGRARPGAPRPRPRPPPGWPRQRGLDLAQLDAEAADLHLVVGAAQELQLRRRRASAPGRRCGTSARPAARRTGRRTKRSAVSSGPAQVAAGQAGAADVQLAGHAHGDRPQPRVEHVERGCWRAGRPIGGPAAVPSASRTRCQVAKVVASVGP